MSGAIDNMAKQIQRQGPPRSYLKVVELEQQRTKWAKMRAKKKGHRIDFDADEEK